MKPEHIALLIFAAAIVFINTFFAYGMKDLKLTKTKTQRIIVLIPPLAFLCMLWWLLKGIFKSIPNYFDDLEKPNKS